MTLLPDYSIIKTGFDKILIIKMIGIIERNMTLILAYYNNIDGRYSWQIIQDLIDLQTKLGLD